MKIELKYTLRYFYKQENKNVIALIAEFDNLPYLIIYKYLNIIKLATEDHVYIKQN